MTLLLSETDVRQVLSYRGVIDLMEQAFADMISDRVLMPQRLLMRLPDTPGLVALMPAHIQGTNILGYKSATAFTDNPRRNLPTVLSVILILDAMTGQPLVIMDGTYITAVRTAAGSGVATRHLARSDSQVLGVVGSGVQAQAHIHAIAEVVPIREVRIFSPRLMTKRDQIGSALAGLKQLAVRYVDSAREAVEACDVVVLATSAAQPVVSHDWFSPGTHINAIGSHAPTTREVDTRTIAQAKVVCDSAAACLAEAGDLLIPIAEQRYAPDRVHASLGEIVLRTKTGRENGTEITLYKSVGLAVQDVLTGDYVYQQARLRGTGVEFNFSA